MINRKSGSGRRGKGKKVPITVPEVMDKKITVMGLGGVGGYLAAMLAKKWPEQVSCIARGKRMESICK